MGGDAVRSTRHECLPPVVLANFGSASDEYMRRPFRCHARTTVEVKATRPIEPNSVESIKRNIIKTMVSLWIRQMRNAHLPAAAASGQQNFQKYLAIAYTPRPQHGQPTDADNGIGIAHTIQCAVHARPNRILARQMECEKQFKSNASGCEFSFICVCPVVALLSPALRIIIVVRLIRNACMHMKRAPVARSHGFLLLNWHI